MSNQTWVTWMRPSGERTLEKLEEQPNAAEVAEFVKDNAVEVPVQYNGQDATLIVNERSASDGRVPINEEATEILRASARRPGSRDFRVVRGNAVLIETGFPRNEQHRLAQLSGHEQDIEP